MLWVGAADARRAALHTEQDKDGQGRPGAVQARQGPTLFVTLCCNTDLTRLFFTSFLKLFYTFYDTIHFIKVFLLPQYY